jgi:NRAMP (natural resistance-associated macrophage protein)-like metal ion transporter
LLDRAHRGDIEGALGRVPMFDTGPRLSLGSKLGTLLAIMGPGLVVMAADEDAGSLSVFAQAGQNYGLRLLWLFLLLPAALFVNQEMVARLGAVTGAGHARLIFERFGRRWGMFALGDLLILNVVTIVTEFIGVALALGYFGVSRYLSVPLAAAALLAMTATGSFRRWERVMYVLVAVNFVAIPLVFLSHPSAGAVGRAFVPGLSGPLDSTNLLFVLALIGTTVSPWQLFFQQSNVVDKRITPRWLTYERTDTLFGTLVFTGLAIAALATCAFAFEGSAFQGAFRDAGGVAHGLASRLGAPAGDLFALALLNASILGAGVITLSTSYAVGDVFGIKHSLHRRWRDAPRFYGSFAAFALVAAAIVLVPKAPLGLVTTAVQALAGVLLPSASVFLLLLCNDRAVLGPWANGRLLNAFATVIVGVLLVLSALVTVTTLLPGVDVEALAIGLASGLAVVLAALAALGSRPRDPSRPGSARAERASWSMPRLESLPRAVPSRMRTLGLAVLRIYIAVAAVLLVVRVARLTLLGS